MEGKEVGVEMKGNPVHSHRKRNHALFLSLTKNEKYLDLLG